MFCGNTLVSKGIRCSGKIKSVLCNITKLKVKLISVLSNL